MISKNFYVFAFFMKLGRIRVCIYLLVFIQNVIIISIILFYLKKFPTKPTLIDGSIHFNLPIPNERRKKTQDKAKLFNSSRYSYTLDPRIFCASLYNSEVNKTAKNQTFKQMNFTELIKAEPDNSTGLNATSEFTQLEYPKLRGVHEILKVQNACFLILKETIHLEIR